METARMLMRAAKSDIVKGYWKREFRRNRDLLNSIREKRHEDRSGR